jgi:hypothetical protein
MARQREKSYGDYLKIVRITLIETAYYRLRTARKKD